MLTLKLCATCKARGAGPGAVKLYPLGGKLYCERGTPAKPGHYREALAGAVEVDAEVYLRWLKGDSAEERAHAADALGGSKLLAAVRYVELQSALAGEALAKDNRERFVRFFVSAMLGWDLMGGRK